MNGKELMENISQVIPEINIFELPTTYRCAREITMCGNIIAKRIDKSSVDTAVNSDGLVLFYDEFETFSQEVEFISKKAIKLFNETQKSIRIIFRTNAQALGFQVHMINNNVPFSSNVKNNIFNRKEIKIALSVVKLLKAGDKIKKAEMFELIKNLKYFIPKRYHSDFYGFQYQVKKIGLNPVLDYAAYPDYYNITGELVRLYNKHRGKSILEIFHFVAEKDEVAEISDGAVDNILGVSELFRDCNTVAEVEEIIKNVSVPKEYSKTQRAIQLSTVHGSKGLESDIVFVCGIGDGLFPLKSGNQDEELRLFYVAVTRAKEELHLSWSQVIGAREIKSSSFIEILQKGL